MEKPHVLRRILLSLAGFVLFWAIVTDAWGYSAYIFHFRNGNYSYAYLSRLIWVSPAILLIVKYSDSLCFNRRQLFSRPPADKALFTVMAVSFLWVAVEMLVCHQGFWWNRAINLPLEIVKFAVVGFAEESVFRGWGYNALTKIISDKKAVLLSTALFILLHWPAYLIRFYRFGSFDFSGIVLQSVSAFIWGIILCRLLKKGRSLWNPIIAHAFYDTIVVLFVG